MNRFAKKGLLIRSVIWVVVSAIILLLNVTYLTKIIAPTFLFIMLALNFKKKLHIWDLWCEENRLWALRNDKKLFFSKMTNAQIEELVEYYKPDLCCINTENIPIRNAQIVLFIAFVMVEVIITILK